MDHDLRKVDILGEEELRVSTNLSDPPLNERRRSSDLTLQPVNSKPVIYDGKSPEKGKKLSGKQGTKISSSPINRSKKEGEAKIMLENKEKEPRKETNTNVVPLHAMALSAAAPVEESKRSAKTSQRSDISEEKKTNPLHPKVIGSLFELYRHAQCLRRAYELLSDIHKGSYLGEHVAHVTEREVLSLRASLEGTKGVTQQWLLLLQHDYPTEEEDDGEHHFERGDPLYRPPTPLPPLGAVGCSSDSSFPFSSSSFGFSSPFHDRAGDAESVFMTVEQERLVEAVYSSIDEEDNPSSPRTGAVHLRHPTQTSGVTTSNNSLPPTATKSHSAKLPHHSTSLSMNSEGESGPPGSYGSSYDVSPSRRTMMAEVQKSIQQCEKMAESLEDYVESSSLAKMCDPVFDIDLPSLSTPKVASIDGAVTKGIAPLSALNPQVLSSSIKDGLARDDENHSKVDQPESTVRLRRTENVKSEKEELTEVERKQRPALPSLFESIPPPAATHSSQVRKADTGSPVTRRQLGIAPSSPDVESPPWPPYWKIILHTPWERRLQLFTVGFFNFFVCCQLCAVLTILLILFGTWYIRWGTLLYVFYIFTVGRPQFPVRYKPWYRSLIIWRYFRDYFPVRQIISDEVRQQFDPSKNYIFGYHPHAAHAFGALVTFGGDANGLTTLLPGIECHLQTLRINFFVPFWRELCCWMGFGDASSTTIRKTLQAGPGQSVVLAVGGAEESLFSRPRSNDLVLAKRKGFVKMALESGSSLAPVYAFGETDTYEVRSIADSPTFFRWAQRVKRITGFMVPMICGRGPLKLIPLRRPIYVVFGAPIDVPKIPKPTAEEIDLYHQKYIEALQVLYQEYCGVLDIGSEKLNIIQ